MSRRSFLVTGGLGFLGGPLVQKLIEQGHRVRVLDNGFRVSTSQLEAFGSEIEVLNGDIRDPLAVDRAVKGVDSVCHLAFVNGTPYFYDRPAYVLDVGVKGIVNVLDSCIRRNIPELILASSSEVYQTPPYVPTDESVPLSIPDVLIPRYSYAAGKIISEAMAVNYGRQYFERVVVFRPHNVFGPQMGWEHVIPELVYRMSQLVPQSSDVVHDFRIQGTGEQSRAFIYIEDFTNAVMRIIEQGEHLNIYHVGTTEERKIADIVRQIASMLGLRIRLVPGPEAEGGAIRRCPSVKKLHAFGFRPQWQFDDAMRVTVDWYRRHLGEYKKRTMESATLFMPEIY